MTLSTGEDEPTNHRGKSTYRCSSLQKAKSHISQTAVCDLETIFELLLLEFIIILCFGNSGDLICSTVETKMPQRKKTGRINIIHVYRIKRYTVYF